MPSHLFVQDADEEEPLAGSQSCPGLVRTEPITQLQSLEALEALMSWTEERESQWNGKAIWIKARQHAVEIPLTRTPFWLSRHSFFCSLLTVGLQSMDSTVLWLWDQLFTRNSFAFVHLLGNCSVGLYKSWGQIHWIPQESLRGIQGSAGKQWVKALPTRRNSNTGLDITAICWEKCAEHDQWGRKKWRVILFHNNMLEILFWFQDLSICWGHYVLAGQTLRQCYYQK